MADFGYDVATTATSIPLFGTLADFDALVAEAHDRGMQVLIDWVPEPHLRPSTRGSSSRARRATTRSGTGTSGAIPRPTAGRRTTGSAASPRRTAWTLDEATGQYYLHLFLPEQPDLNWRNPEVVAAMHDTLRFWLDRGVDGFRMDVIQCIVKRADLADVDDGLDEMLDGDAHLDPPATHELLRDIRRLLDGYPGDRVSVGEVYLLSTAKVATLLRRRRRAAPRASTSRQLLAPWDVERSGAAGSSAPTRSSTRSARWPTWVLSNHDIPRHRTRYGGPRRGRAPPR